MEDPINRLKEIDPSACLSAVLICPRDLCKLKLRKVAVVQRVIGDHSAKGLRRHVQIATFR
jgi:hypothetical protein